MNIEGTEYKILIGDRTFHCALDVTMHVIGGKSCCGICARTASGSVNCAG